MALQSDKGNILSSTNIAEILESQIKAIKKIDDLILKNKIDEAMLKRVSDIVKPISEVIKSLNIISSEMSSFKISDVLGNAKFNFAVDNLVKNIIVITNGLSNIKVDKDMAKNSAIIKNTVKDVVEIGKQLTLLGVLAPFIIITKPLISKVIDIILDINNQLTKIGKRGANAAQNAAVIGTALGTFAKGLLIFVVATMGGIVPLVAIIALLATKAFLTVFFKLFGKNTAKKIDETDETLNKLSKTLIILSATVLLWALTGDLIKEEWDSILVTLGFVILAIGVFVLLGFLTKYIDEGNKSLLMIASTLILLSLTVLLWALTGDLIKEEWDSILVTIMFVIGAIGLMILLGVSSKFIKDGEKTLIILALTLVILSLTVLLWTLTGDAIKENWASILLVSGFVTLAIGLMLLLGFVGSKIKEGAMSMLILAGALVVLSLLVFLFVATGKNLKDNWVSILIMMGFIAILIGISIALGAIKEYALIGAAVLAILAGVMLIFAISLKVIASASNMLTWDGIKLMCAFIVGIGAATAVAGAMSPLILLGSAALTVLGAAMLILMPGLLMFTSAIERLQKIDVTEDQIRKPIILIKALVTEVNKQFGVKGTISLLKASAKMLMMIPIISTLGNIATVLQNIASLSIPTGFDKNGKATGYTKMTSDDFLNAAANAAGIVSIIAHLFGDDEVTVTIGGKQITISPITEDDLGKISKSTKNKMVIIGEITFTIASIASVLQNIASLSIPTGFDKNGKVIGYRPMNENDFAKASENVTKIITELLSVIGSDETTKIIDDLSKKSIENFSRIIESTSGVSNLIDAIQKMVNVEDTEIEKSTIKIKTAITSYLRMLNDLFVSSSEIVWKDSILGLKYPTIVTTNEPEFNLEKLVSLKAGLEQVLDTINYIDPLIESIKKNAEAVKDIDASNIGKVIQSYVQSVYGDSDGNGGIYIDRTTDRKTKFLQQVIKQQERLAKIDTGNLQKNTESFIKFVDKANTIDSNKIKSIRDMFEQMAAFSKSIHGDFDKLADVLSDKLVDILQKLHVTLEDMSKSENNAVSTTNTVTETTKQTTEKVETKNQKIEEKQNQNAQNLKDIKDSLEELTAILRDVRDNTENINGY